VIVRRDGDGGTLIRQVDHVAHCGRLARAWRDRPFGRDSVSASLEHAATHHNVGWTDNDLEPEIDGEGKPSNFTQIDEARHTKFYSGAVSTMLVAMPMPPTSSACTHQGCTAAVMGGRASAHLGAGRFHR